jgi:hypothetical protein
MKQHPKPTAIPTLRDAYKVCGFRGRARIDSYDELKPPAFVLTLDRRSKKRGAAGAEKGAAAFTANAGDVGGTSVAGIEKSISIVPCAA